MSSEPTKHLRDPARRGRVWTAAVVVTAALCMGQSGTFPGVQLEDRIDLVQIDNQVLAIDAKSRRQRAVDLEVGEQVITLDQRGLVAVIVTTARVLGITTQLADFQELRYRVLERSAPPAEVFVGDRVALVQLRRRLVAMSTTTRSWQEIGVGPREQIDSIFAERNFVAVISQRRALAFSVNTSQFIEIVLTPQEVVEAVSTNDSSITLTTSRRILIFRAGDGMWTELTRRNRPG